MVVTQDVVLIVEQGENALWNIDYKNVSRCKLHKLWDHKYSEWWPYSQNVHKITTTQNWSKYALSYESCRTAKLCTVCDMAPRTGHVVLGPVLLTLLRHVARILANGSAVFFESCITNVIATCRKNFSQWERSFLWKLRCHWLKFLRRVAKTLVIQGRVHTKSFYTRTASAYHQSWQEARS